jgi:O-antigen/teichoic acid export membrane protein
VEGGFEMKTILKILGTLSSRVLGSLITLFLLGFWAKVYGFDFVGFISLFTLQISISFIFSGIFAGSSAIFFSEKWQTKPLLLASGLGTLTLSVLSSLGLLFLGLVPQEAFSYFLLASLIHALTSLLQSIHLGRGEVGIFNHIQLIQNLGLPLFFFLLPVTSAFDCYGFSWIGSQVMALFYGLIRFSRKSELEAVSTWVAIKSMFRYGVWGQLTNLGQMLNYRFSFFLLNSFFGREAVGVFSAAIQLAESTWLPAKSIGTVHLSELLHLEDKEDSTPAAMKVAFWASMAGVLALMLLPNAWFTEIFGNKFVKAFPYFLGLAPGIVLFSFVIIIAQSFAAKNKIQLNAIATLFALLATLFFSFALVPTFEVLGAVIATSISHVINAFVLLFFFHKSNPISWKYLLNPFQWKISK